MLPTTKIEVVDGVSLIAVSGPVGLGQRLHGEFQRMLKGGTLKGAPYRVMSDLRVVFWNQIKPEFEAANVARGSIGNVANESVLSSTLLAMNVGGSARLFAFDQQGAPEEITVKIPAVSAGSGQRNADVFLAFLRSVYWEEGKAPSLGDGIFATLWTLEQCIDTSAGGLKGPARIFTLEVTGGKGVARQLADTDLDEHRQAIEAGKVALLKAREETSAPPPPKPASAGS
jgi:hypothetical protein